MAQTYIAPRTLAPDYVPKVFSAQLFRQALWECFWVNTLSGYGKNGFIWKPSKKIAGTGSNFPLSIIRDLEKRAGDEVDVDLRKPIKAQPVFGDDQLKGKEASLSLTSTGLKIDQVRFGANAGGRMTQKRTKHDLRALARDELRITFAQFFDEVLTVYAAGTRGIDTINWEVLPVGWNGFAGNPVEDYATEYKFCLDSSGQISNDPSQADHLALKWLDKLRTYIGTQLAKKPMPLYDGKEPFYILVLHPMAAEDLKSETGAKTWLEIQKFANVRGSENPLFRGTLGKYNIFWMHEYSKVPVVKIGNDYYAYNLLLGSQALLMAFGSAGGAFSISWHEEMDDRGNQFVVTAGCIFGVRRTRFEDKEFAAMLIPSKINWTA